MLLARLLFRHSMSTTVIGNCRAVPPEVDERATMGDNAWVRAHAIFLIYYLVQEMPIVYLLVVYHWFELVAHKQ